jgi:hypothetical protein
MPCQGARIGSVRQVVEGAGFAFQWGGAFFRKHCVKGLRGQSFKHDWNSAILVFQDRVHPHPDLQGFSGSAVGYPPNGREKAWPMEGHHRVPSLFSKRSDQVLRPGPPHPKPLSN